MANRGVTRQPSHHVRFDSLPTTLEVIKSQIEEGTSSNDEQSQEFYVPSKAKSLRVKNNRRKHKKSASIEISGLANTLGLYRNASGGLSDDDSKVSHENHHSYNMSMNMIANLKKYNRKQQEDLISIQINLKKWIGSEEYLILSQFLDLMNKIAPHISTQEATNMFNQMDASSNGQIPTSLLLHDEFLPRMILNLFQKEDDNESVGTRNTNTSLPDDFGLDEDDDDDTDYENMDNQEFSTKAKSMKQEIKRLKQWILDQGQPAIEKVDELQMMLNVYEEERHDKQFELQSFQNRLSKMENLEQALVQSRASSNLLLKENDSLLLSVHESTKQHEMERKKYNEALHEAQKFKQLAKELQDINDKYNKKNQNLNEKQIKLEEENQNLRQILLQYETEQTQQFAEYNQAIEVMNNQVKHLQDEMEHNHHDQQSINTVESPNNRVRRMTLKSTSTDDDDIGINTMASEIDNSLTGRGSGRKRRDTIRMWYATHSKNGSLTEQQLKSMAEDADADNNVVVINLDRQDSLQSHQSSNGTRPTLDPYRSHDSYISTPGNGALGGGVSTIRSQLNDDIFEDAIAQELKTQIRKQIEKELQEDYALKLKQRDIEYEMKLHKEKEHLNDKQRKFREQYEKKIDSLHNKLTEYSKGGKVINLIDDMSFENDEMVYLGGNGGRNDGNDSSAISEYEDIDSDDEKDVFDENMMNEDYHHENERNMAVYGGGRNGSDDLEQRPLMMGHKKKDDEDAEYVENVMRNRKDKKGKKKKKGKKDKNKNKEETSDENNVNVDDKCFSCFGLFTGTGV